MVAAVLWGGGLSLGHQRNLIEEKNVNSQVME